MFVIAYEDGKPVGCGCFREISSNTAEIKRMYAKVKRHRVGEEILKYLEKEARKLDYSQIILETRKININAVNFYLKNGYKICSNYGKYENRLDTVCLKKELY